MITPPMKQSGKRRNNHPAVHSLAPLSSGPLKKILRRPHQWRNWHERETPVQVQSVPTEKGIRVSVRSSQFSKSLHLVYPPSIWKPYPRDNKIKLVDNISYVFTAHLPFLLRGNVRLEYSTGYPHVYSWAIQSFMRNLPAYWYMFKGKRGSNIFPILKVLLNSNYYFSETADTPPQFPSTIDEHVIIPFTFGKDSFLSYHIAKEIGLQPTLLWFNDPVDQGYEGKHKLKLFQEFSSEVHDPMYYLNNPLGSLRERGDGPFGWEMAITSWVLLSLPFAYVKKAGYIIASNERSTNYFFYDKQGMKIIPDYEQSAQATEELSILTQALSEGEVYTTTFLQGLEDIAIIAILKDRYAKKTFPYLMSCWSDEESGKNKRWCASCSKCARIYCYLIASGVDPKEAGFKDNMFLENKAHLFNVFGKKASGTGWDAFGLNTTEQSLAFYIAYLRGNRDPLIKKFKRSSHFRMVSTQYAELVDHYFSVHYERTTPPQWKRKIDSVYRASLNRVKKELMHIRSTAIQK